MLLIVGTLLSYPVALSGASQYFCRNWIAKKWLDIKYIHKHRHLHRLSTESTYGPSAFPVGVKQPCLNMHQNTGDLSTLTRLNVWLHVQ